MQFILVYNRPRMQLLEKLSFTDEQSLLAREAKLSLELRHANSDDIEVAFFQSDSEATLRRTHSRYFKSLGEMAAEVNETLKSP